MRLMRCICCREMGHSIENCTRDPNFKTNRPSGADLERIQKIKTFKKLHADTMINTTHFIKKSVMVPIKQDEDNGIFEP